jgi:hypothetical protein
MRLIVTFTVNFFWDRVVCVVCVDGDDGDDEVESQFEDKPR